MKVPDNIINLGLSKYEAQVYLALVGDPPMNGSQLSRISGVPRANIYNVLKALRDKGMVAEVQKGLYSPLPPEELIKRLRYRCDNDLAVLEKMVKTASSKITYDYVWTIKGHSEVMAKAEEMIQSSKTDIYVRLYQEEGLLLGSYLQEAASRNVQVKYISVGQPATIFPLQVIHPESGKLEVALDGRVIDLIVDRAEVLTGRFQRGNEDGSPINWTRSQWLVNSSRESLRHDFYHYFLYKLHEEKKSLTKKESELYELIKQDY